MNLILLRTTQNIIGMLGKNLLLLVIRPTLPYMHSLIVLRLHLSHNTIYGHVLFLFHKFIVREKKYNSHFETTSSQNSYRWSSDCIYFTWDTYSQRWTSLRVWKTQHSNCNSQHYYIILHKHQNQQLVVTYWFFKLMFS